MPAPVLSDSRNRARRLIAVTSALAVASIAGISGAGSASALIAPIVPPLVLSTQTDNHMVDTLTGRLVEGSGHRLPVGVVLPPVVTTPEPALYLSYGATPSDSDLVFAAAHYTVAVLNPYDIASMKRLKALNPTMKVLEYKDLASVRSTDQSSPGVDLAHGSSGVGWNEALAHGDTWFAHKANTTDGQNGQRISWNGYASQFQVALWNQDYQKAWINDVYNDVTQNGWDGVLVDNYMASLGYYYGYVNPAEDGSTVEEGSLGSTDAAIQQAELDITSGVTQSQATSRGISPLTGIGPMLNGAGKLYIPSVSDGRDNLTRWAALTQYGGGMEENWTHWDSTGDTNPNGYFYDWDGPGTANPSGFRAQQEQPALTCPIGGCTKNGPNGLFLAVTSARPQDGDAYTFGFASFLVGSGNVGAFTAITRDGYNGIHLRTEQTWNLGVPTTAAVQTGELFSRTFVNGWAAVNPSRTDSITVTAPPGMSDSFGNVISTLTLAPISGIVLHRA